MKPPASALLLGMATRLAALSAEPADTFSAFELQIMALASATLIADVERGAAIRSADIAGYQALLERGTALGAPLDRAPATGADELTMAALEARRASLGRQVIALHEWLEASEHPDAAVLLEDVWRELRAGNERRAAP